MAGPPSERKGGAVTRAERPQRCRGTPGGGFFQDRCALEVLPPGGELLELDLAVAVGVDGGEAYLELLLGEAGAHGGEGDHEVAHLSHAAELGLMGFSGFISPWAGLQPPVTT